MPNSPFNRKLDENFTPNGWRQSHIGSETSKLFRAAIAQTYGQLDIDERDEKNRPREVNVLIQVIDRGNVGTASRPAVRRSENRFLVARIAPIRQIENFNQAVTYFLN